MKHSIGESSEISTHGQECIFTSTVVILLSMNMHSVMNLYRDTIYVIYISVYTVFTGFIFLYILYIRFSLFSSLSSRHMKSSNLFSHDYCNCFLAQGV